MSSCIPEDRLLAFARSEVSPEESASIDTHLDMCTRCQESIDRITQQVLQAILPQPFPLIAEVRPEVPGYRVVRELGRGGMGIVWLAEQLSLKRLVALKTIRVQLGSNTDELSRRLQIEAEAIGRLAHPNIVRVLEAGSTVHGPYFTMEYVEGGSLEERLTGDPWPPMLSARLMTDVANAIQRAHEAGIVHRDLKPSNILLDSVDTHEASSTPKISDFGLAKLLDGSGEETASGRVLGTPNYMSPEQASGRSIDIGPATDVYAIGAVLYELLTGRPPFRGVSPLDTIQLIRSSDVVSPRHLVPNIPRDLEKITLKCLEKDAGSRYASARLLAEDLVRFQRGDPVTARAPGLWRQWRQVGRKYPAIVRAISLLVVVVPLLGMAGWQAYRFRESQRAQRALETKSLEWQASLHAERGEWALAVEFLNRALAEGHPEPAKLGVEKVRALFVLNRQEIGSTLDSLEHAPDIESVRAEWLLLKGDWLLGHDNSSGRDLIKQAIERGLRRKSDQRYAEGLLSPKAGDARKMFEFAVEEEKFHPRANQLLVLTLLATGNHQLAHNRIELMRGALGSDPGFRLLQTTTYELAGEVDHAKSVRDSLHETFGPEWHQRAVELDQQVKLFTTGTDAIVPDPSAFLSALAGKRAAFATGLKMPNVPVPLFLAQIDELWQAILAATSSPTDKAKAQDLVNLAHESPDGMVQFMTGLVLLRDKRFVEAEQFMLRAADLPSTFNIRRPALFSAVACQGSFLSNPKHPELERIRARSGKTVQKLWESGLPAIDWCSIFAHTARRCGQYDIAHSIVDHWAKNGEEVTEIDLLHGQIFYSAGRYALAIEKANAVLDRKPDHAEAKNLLNLATDKLDSELKRVRSNR